MHDSERNGHHFPYSEEEENLLTDECDHDILMHRDAHFGGDFKVMLDYYLGDHLGVNPDFEIDRIEYLAEVEKEMGQNLASLLLSGPEAEKVARVRLAYKTLKALYEIDDETSEIPRLIADLILSEEESPEAEIEAVVARGAEAIPELIHILRSDEAYDPLFPGYGYAPYLAIICLGKLKAHEAIVPLFEVLNQITIFEEDVLLDAFHEIGDSAKAFLLKVLKGRPLSQDNRHAAFALTAFTGDLDVAKVALEQLQDPIVRRDPLLCTYLLASVEPLKNSPHRDEFLSLRKDRTVPEALRDELDLIAEDWGVDKT